MNMDVEKTIRRLAEAGERHNREISAIRAELRKGVRASVEEQRRERVRRQEVEGQADELRLSLKRFIDAQTPRTALQ